MEQNNSEQMSGMKAVMLSLLETAFLNVLVINPIVVAGSCEKLFGAKSTAKVVAKDDKGFVIEVTAKGETMTITAKLNNGKVASVSVNDGKYNG